MQVSEYIILVNEPRKKVNNMKKTWNVTKDNENFPNSLHEVRVHEANTTAETLHPSICLSLYIVSSQNHFKNLIQFDKSRIYNKIWSQTLLAYDTQYLHGMKHSTHSFESNTFSWNFFDNG
jgi:hypothetical protein